MDTHLFILVFTSLLKSTKYYYLQYFYSSICIYFYRVIWDKWCQFILWIIVSIWYLCWINYLRFIIVNVSRFIIHSIRMSFRTRKSLPWYFFSVFLWYNVLCEYGTISSDIWELLPFYIHFYSSDRQILLLVGVFVRYVINTNTRSVKVFKVINYSSFIRFIYLIVYILIDIKMRMFMYMWIFLYVRLKTIL